MLKKLLLTGSICCLSAIACGCHHSSEPDDAPATREAEAPAIPIPPDSPLAKINKDMGMKEVTDILGPPTDTTSHITGKQFNPFYYGGDTHRVIYLYKGLGRITFTRPHAFTGDMRVMSIEYDPNESGYK